MNNLTNTINWTSKNTDIEFTINIKRGFNGTKIINADLFTMTFNDQTITGHDLNIFLSSKNTSMFFSDTAIITKLETAVENIIMYAETENEILPYLVESIYLDGELLRCSQVLVNIENKPVSFHGHKAYGRHYVNIDFFNTIEKAERFIRARV